jgi:hypothetical protein
MYPTTIIGVALVLTAFGFGAKPDARRRELVRALATLTLLSSCLGFVAGVIKCCTAANELVPPAVVVRGVGESLSNIGLGLVLLVLAGIGTAIGVARRTDTDRPDLHGV